MSFFFARPSCPNQITECARYGRRAGSRRVIDIWGFAAGRGLKCRACTPRVSLRFCVSWHSSHATLLVGRKKGIASSVKVLSSTLSPEINFRDKSRHRSHVCDYCRGFRGPTLSTCRSGDSARWMHGRCLHVVMERVSCRRTRRTGML